MRTGHSQDFGLHGGVKIPEWVDKYLGDGSEEEIVLEMGGLLDNPEAAKYVEAIGEKLVTNSKRKGALASGDLAYKFGIVRSDTPNAFALPNGSIYVTLGLLRLMKNETELANVMGHEVGHVENRHSVKQVKVDLVTQGVVSLLLALGKSALSKGQREEIKEFSLGFISNGYSRECEDEADADGQTLATSVGWDPRGMVELMQLFLSMNEKRPEGIEAYMQSHPFAGDRVALAQKRIPSLKSGFPKATAVGEEKYKGFLSNVLKMTPTQIAAAQSGTVLKTLGPGGAVAASQDVSILNIVGYSLIGVSALALIYLLLVKKD